MDCINCETTLKLDIMGGESVDVTVAAGAIVLDVKFSVAALLTGGQVPWKLLLRATVLEDSLSVDALGIGQLQLLLAPDREELLRSAKAAQAEAAYDDMIEDMTTLTDFADELSYEERLLLLTAYLQAHRCHREEWLAAKQSACDASHQEEWHTAATRKNGSATQAQRALELGTNKLIVLSSLCDKAVEVSEKLLTRGCANEVNVFYHKMRADFCRYITEFAEAPAKAAASSAAAESYAAAIQIAQAELAPVHPLRLGVALNFSIFTYHVLNDKDEAVRIARIAFEDALEKLDTVCEKTYKACTLVLQLLRDSLTVWVGDSSMDVTIDWHGMFDQIDIGNLRANRLL